MVCCQWESQGVTHHRFARLNLVDLAGSERYYYVVKGNDIIKEGKSFNDRISIDSHNYFMYTGRRVLALKVNVSRKLPILTNPSQHWGVVLLLLIFSLFSQ